jgi:hypothetical protein
LHTDGLKISGRCSFPARTREPTGVIELVRPAVPITLGEFFAIWRQPLGPHRLVGFRAVGVEHVRAWLNGRSWRGDLRSIPLIRHSEIVLELGRFVPPHSSYRFEKGL